METPDESYQCINLDGRSLILSVSETPVTLGQSTALGNNFTAKTEVTIFAEKIHVSDSVRGKNFGIFTNSLAVEKSPEFDVSGSPGQSGTATPEGDGSAGGPGTDAGAINAYVETFTEDLLQLKFLLQGGKGGDGQDTMNGKGGDGGNGGKGGTIHLVYSNPNKVILSKIDTIFKIKGEGGDDTSKDANALQKKRDAIKSLVPELKSISAGRDVLSHCVSQLETVVNDSTKTVRNLEEQLDNVDRSLRAQSNYNCTAILTNIGISGGQYGTFGSGTTQNGQSGKPGEQGNQNVTEFGFEPDVMRNIPFVFAHPDQCQMLLQKASTLYYAGDIQKSVVLLKRLLNRLRFVDSLSKADRLYQAYQDNEARLFTSRSIERLKSIYKTANGLMRQINLRQDFYGRSYQYTPRGSYKFYDDQSQRLLNNLEIIESAYSDYFKSLKTQSASIDMVKSARSHADLIIEQANGIIDRLKKEVEITSYSIAAFDPVIKSKRQEVHGLIENVKEEIKNTFSVNFSDIVNALTLCAFAPNKFMMSIQLGDLLYKASAEIPDDQGNHVNKGYLLNSISDCEASEEALLEAYHRRNDGKLEVDDLNASKLIVEEQKLNELLGKYRSQLSSSTLTNLKKAFDDYVKTVIERNNTVIHYNAVIQLWVKYQNQIRYYQTIKNSLTDTALVEINPDFPLVSTYMAQMYNDARSQVLESLYLTQRALSFWSLTTVHAIQQVLGELPLSGVTHAVATQLKSNLLTEFSKAIENYGLDAQIFPAHGSSFGETIKLTDNQIQALKYSNGVILNIPPIFKETPKKPSVSPFVGWANVRLTKVRVWVNGAKTDDNELQVSIRHFGKETIVNQSNAEFKFEHDPVEIGFKYNLSTNSIIEDGDISQEDKTYASIGPFATWRIFINPNENDKLDLSAVTAVNFEFWGTNYLFHS